MACQLRRGITAQRKATSKTSREAPVVVEIDTLQQVGQVIDVAKGHHHAAAGQRVAHVVGVANRNRARDPLPVSREIRGVHGPQLAPGRRVEQGGQLILSSVGQKCVCVCVCVCVRAWVDECSVECVAPS